MENDASRLFELLLQSNSFNSFFERASSSPSAVLECINQAMYTLMNSKHCHITAGENFVLSYVLQLVVRNMCKALMQVMTPEGLIKFRKSIPRSFLHTYLYQQDHFSLKKIIDREVLRNSDDRK